MNQQIESIEQRARELVTVCSDALRGAGALRRRVAPASTGAQVHRPNEHEPCRKERSSLRASNLDRTVLERLAKRFQRRSIELRQLVQEEDALVGQAGLPRLRARPAAHDRSRGRGVVRSAKRRALDEGTPGRQEARHRVDAGHLEGFLQRQGRQDPWKASGQHRLPGSGGPGEQKVVPAGRGELQSAARPLLPANFREVWPTVSGRGNRWVDGPGIDEAAQIRACFRQVLDRHGFDPGERRLRS
jgi:hypothetical protein